MAKKKGGRRSKDRVTVPFTRGAISAVPGGGLFMVANKIASFRLAPYSKKASKPFVPVVYKPYAVKHVGPAFVPSGRVSPWGRHDGTGIKFSAKVPSDKKTAGHAKRRARSAKERPSGGRTGTDKEPENQSSKTRDVCKERPDSKKARKGSGGSKEFVPWCK